MGQLRGLGAEQWECDHRGPQLGEAKDGERCAKAQGQRRPTGAVTSPPYPTLCPGRS
jgi:hypothetical protein